MQRTAFHENAAAFGPCQSGASFFCQGYGTERENPDDPFAAAPVIICFPCFSHAEARQIEQNVLGIIGERAA